MFIALAIVWYRDARFPNSHLLMTTGNRMEAHAVSSPPDFAERKNMLVLRLSLSALRRTSGRHAAHSRGRIQ